MSASNDQIYNAILDLKGEVGETKQTARNAHEFAAAVSKKADSIRSELEDHKKSPEAHGIAAEKRGRAGVVAAFGFIGMLLGAMVSAIAILKFLVPKVAAG